MPQPVDAWPNGSVKGLKARGNVTVDFTWKDGKVTAVNLRSPKSKKVKVRYNGEVKVLQTKPLAAKKKK